MPPPWTQRSKAHLVNLLKRPLKLSRVLNGSRKQDKLCGRIPKIWQRRWGKTKQKWQQQQKKITTNRTESKKETNTTEKSKAQQHKNGRHQQQITQKKVDTSTKNRGPSENNPLCRRKKGGRWPNVASDFNAGRCSSRSSSLSSGDRNQVFSGT